MIEAPKLFDSHCHLDFTEFDADRQAVLERAWKAGVRGLWLPGVNPADSAKLPELVAKLQSAGFVAGFGVGLHPYFHEPGRDVGAVARELEELATTLAPQAIGECGVDRPHAEKNGAPLDEQLVAVEAQLALARKFDCPAVVHVVRAHGAFVELLERIDPVPRGIVLHSYSGSAELVARYADLGCYFGFGAAALRSNARRARAAVERVPAGRLLLETDAPDQAPERAERNEPAALARIVEGLAQIRQEPVGLLAARTFDNATRVFNLA